MHVVDRVLSFGARMAKTRLNYWAEFAVDIPLSATLIVAGLLGNEHGPFLAALCILLGMFIFSIIEYAFHRWLFHGTVQYLAQGHLEHHKNPLGYDSLPFFFPALVLLTLLGILIVLIPAHAAFLLVGAIGLSYVTYGLCHFTIHHHRFQYAPVRDWAANHLVHHHHPEANFGVTTPLWDNLLGTRYLYKGITK